MCVGMDGTQTAVCDDGQPNFTGMDHYTQELELWPLHFTHNWDHADSE